MADGKKIKGIVSIGEISKVEHDYVPIKQFVSRDDVEVWSGDINANWLMSSIKNKLNTMPLDCDFFIMGYDGSQVNLSNSIKSKIKIAFDPFDFPELVPKPISSYDVLFKLQVNKNTRYIKDDVVIYPYPVSDNKIVNLPGENNKRDIDIVFIGGLWPPEINNEHPRYKIVKILKDHFKDKFFGGITNPGTEISIPSMPLKDYINILGRSKVCINVSNKLDIINGRHCRRQSEAMMMGCKVVSHRMESEWYRDPKDLISYFNFDFSDLISVCEKSILEWDYAFAKKIRNFFDDEYLSQGDLLYNAILKRIKI